MIHDVNVTINTIFSIPAGEIKTKIDLDYEDIVERYGTNRFYVQVTADDGREKSQTKRIEIVVNDVNEPPEYNQFKYSIEADEGSVRIA